MVVFFGNDIKTINLVVAKIMLLYMFPVWLYWLGLNEVEVLNRTLDLIIAQAFLFAIGISIAFWCRTSSNYCYREFISQFQNTIVIMLLKRFQNWCITFQFWLQQLIDEPTHVVSDSSFCINLVHISKPTLLMESRGCTPHYIQIIIIK